MRSKKKIMGKCDKCWRLDQTFNTEIRGRLSLVAAQLQCQVCTYGDILEVMVDIRDLLAKRGK